MNVQGVTLALATISTGMMAGVFFTWSNAVTPGLNKLADIEYLRALQSMNRVILNPMFYILFMGAVIFICLATAVLFRSNPSHLVWMLLSATVIYCNGVLAVTVWGNIPLNDVLDRADLGYITTDKAKSLRSTIENRWNNFNMIRSIASSISFLILIIVCVLANKVNLP